MLLEEILAFGIMPLMVVIDLFLIYLSYIMGRAIKNLFERAFSVKITFEIHRNDWRKEDMKMLKKEIAQGVGK